MARWNREYWFFPISIWHKQWQTCLLLENSVENDHNSLYFHPKVFQRTSKLNSYLMSISRRDPVNLSTLPFAMLVLQKQWQIYLLFEKSLKNGCDNLYFHPYTFNMSNKLFSCLTSLSPYWIGKSVNPKFRQYQSDRSNIICCLKIQSKMTAVIFLCTLYPLKTGFHCGFKTSVLNLNYSKNMCVF